MRIVHKWLLHEGINVISVPANSEIISVGKQRGIVGFSLWALVNPTATIMEDRKILTITTGEETEEVILKFLGTIMEYDGMHVTHIFEIL
jgi:hypothetical protein